MLPHVRSLGTGPHAHCPTGTGQSQQRRCRPSGIGKARGELLGRGARSRDGWREPQQGFSTEAPPMCWARHAWLWGNAVHCGTCRSFLPLDAGSTPSHANHRSIQALPSIPCWGATARKEGVGLVTAPQGPTEGQDCSHQVVGSRGRWLSGARGPGRVPGVTLTTAGREAGSAPCRTGRRLSSLSC